MLVLLACVKQATSLHAGLMLVLLYGREGWFSPVLRAAGFNVVFAFPGTCIPRLFVLYCLSNCMPGVTAGSEAGLLQLLGTKKFIGRADS